MRTPYKKAAIRNHRPIESRSSGFSLFELVVFIILVSIIYATAANRFAAFPGQAERANFIAISTQIQSALNLEMMIGIGTGRISSPSLMEGVNPMDLLLQPPSNYIGAFDLVDAARIERRVWYFDRTEKELVYLVNDATGVFLVRNGVDTPTDEIRFRIELDYREEDTRTGLPVEIAESGGRVVSSENRRRRFNGIVMRVVTPYRWGRADGAVLVAAAN